MRAGSLLSLFSGFMARLFVLWGIAPPLSGHCRACPGLPLVVGVGLFVLSTLLFSAAATAVILMPVGVALGIPATMLIAFYPAVNGVFFLPTYGTLLAAVSFDQTGTTRIGKYLLNHSFMLPGLVTTFSATAIALVLTTFL
jgi:anaerobic C4-dicarboxylate transporter